MQNRNWIYLLGFVFLVYSCKTGKIGGTADCPKKDTEETIELLRSKSKTPFEFYYTKLGVTVKDSESSNSFKTSLKLRTDSAFAGILKVAGIVGAAYLADTDTIAFTNKIKRCYFKKDFGFLVEKFGMDLNYGLMQELLLGQPFGLNTVQELYPLKDDHYYVLASHDKKAIDRLTTGALEEDEVEDFFFRYKIDCGTMELGQILINAPSMLTSIQIDFVKRQEVDGYSLPQETEIKVVSPKDSTFISLDYGTTTLNDYKKISISIPDSYNECE